MGGRRLGLAALALLAVAALPSSEIIADSERSIAIKNMHTGETLDLVFKRRGRYQAEAMRQINWIMRDWRRDETIRVDPRLVDLVYDVHKAVGSRVPIELLSGYRSPATNEALRRRSRNVAKFSQHMVGKAMDFRIRDVNVNTVRETAMKMQRGGVGYYGGTYVHLDVASVRHWPRMSRSRLTRLFPDGRTVHIPSDGRPLSGYADAKRAIERSGGRSGSTELEEDDRDTDRRSITNRNHNDAGLVLAGNEAYVPDAQPTRPTIRERRTRDDDTAVATAPSAPARQEQPPARSAPEPEAPAQPAETETTIQLPTTVPAPRPRPDAPAEIGTLIAAVDPSSVPLPRTKPDIAGLIAAAPDVESAETGAEGIETLIASADGVPLPPQRPLVGAPPSETTFAQSDATSPITALLANDLPSSLASSPLRGALPQGVFEDVALYAAEPSARSIDVLVSSASIAMDDRVSTFHHPEQTEVDDLVHMPKAMLDSGFHRGGIDLRTWYRSEFTGSAIEALQTRLLLRTGATADGIGDHLTTSALGPQPETTSDN